MLREIVACKRDEVNDRKSSSHKLNLQRIIADTPFAVGFAKALHGTQGECPRLIAEVKKQSPSGGVLRDPFDPLAIANAYKSAGASALSVLTDQRYFHGSLDIMATVGKAVALPVLNKEFMVDEIQFYEARAYRADAVLLIVAILERSQLIEYSHLAQELGLDVLVEIHTEGELAIATDAMPDIQLLGINNRDLTTLTTDLATTFRLVNCISSELRNNMTIVSESGISSRIDVERLAEVGIHAMLVGEALLKAQNISRKVSELLDASLSSPITS
ncbi:MAG: indole-3-glycerol phosphate synthase [Nitrospiraceae bacterium]|nr:indole-3-glycerol phosphate synthase [Nitrospiraceae bacterium]|tara:strand:- start:416 stop:1237 length:822 start_codon:yes stop_codon:yes gene_type:complete